MPRAPNLENFDYETPRSIYSECQAAHCPNLEVEFLAEFLRREYNLILVTNNQPYSKFKTLLDKKCSKNECNKIFFIDCVSKIGKVKTEKNVILLENRASLSSMARSINKLWSSIKGKKILFFDCAEILTYSYDIKEIFGFTHRLIQNLQGEGIVIFCFLKDSMEKSTETKFKHLFDETISL